MTLLWPFWACRRSRVTVALCQTTLELDKSELDKSELDKSELVKSELDEVPPDESLLM
jgi:hypothetical protein